MTKRNLTIIAAVTLVVVVSLATVLSYVSLLGENRKINDVASALFEGIKNKQYGEACGELPTGAGNPFSSSAQSCPDAVFLLELSLLKQFDLLDSPGYTVVAERNRFWVPFFRDGPVSVKILLRGQAKKSVGKDFSVKSLIAYTKVLFTTAPGYTQPFVDHLLTLERRDGRWRITRIDVAGNALGPVYADLEKRLGRYAFPEKTRDGFTVEPLVIKYADMTAVDKRIMKHNLQKIESLIDAK